MEVYLVGGAVRDELLGLTPSERDWVIVGASEKQMLDLGYRRVGKDFPVFLHPETKEEYALARRERKRGHGYKGFDYDAGPGVSLEDDLLRRDLTINAIARTDDGRLIDPHGGTEDLEKRLLRHVSAAFSEDPLRVLRTARFAAQFRSLGFRIAQETLYLMTQITNSGELDYLVPERVWQETGKALMTDAPDVFIKTLRECGALSVLFPEVDALFGVPQTAKYHPEIDTGKHILLCLKQCARQQASQAVRVAVLLHDLGKGTSPPGQLPSHTGHEHRGTPLVRTVAERLKLPKAQQELAELVCKHHLRCHHAVDMKPTTLVELLKDLDAWRKPDRFESFLLACEIDKRGREGQQDAEYPSRGLLQELHRITALVSLDESEVQDLTGSEIAARIHSKRVAAVSQYLQRKAN